MHTLRTGVPVSALECHPDSGLVAAACDDLSVRVYDVLGKKRVRVFKGHTNRITDMVGRA